MCATSSLRFVRCERLSNQPSGRLACSLTDPRACVLSHRPARSRAADLLDVLIENRIPSHDDPSYTPRVKCHIKTDPSGFTAYKPVGFELIPKALFEVGVPSFLGVMESYPSRYPPCL